MTKYRLTPAPYVLIVTRPDGSENNNRFTTRRAALKWIAHAERCSTTDARQRLTR